MMDLALQVAVLVRSGEKYCDLASKDVSTGSISHHWIYSERYGKRNAKLP
jgi:hypothetical protein